MGKWPQKVDSKMLKLKNKKERKNYLKEHQIDLFK